MKLKVIGYADYPDYFYLCLDEKKVTHRVDLRVSKETESTMRALPTSFDDLIGKTVEVEELIPLVEIGYEVKIVEE